MATNPTYNLVNYLYGHGTDTSTGGKPNAPGQVTPPEVTVRDEGLIIAKVLQDIDFIGSGVVAIQDNATGKLTVSIPGASGGGASLVVSKANNSGVTIPAFAPVSERADGSITLATVANINDENVFGIALSSIDHGTSGEVQYAGLVENALVGLPGGSVPEDAIYLGAIPGQLTKTAPTGSGQLVLLVGSASGPAGQSLQFNPRKISRNP